MRRALPLRSSIFRLILALTSAMIVMLSTLACDQEGAQTQIQTHTPTLATPVQSQKEGRVIARVGEERITTLDLERWIGSLPPLTRSRYQRRERQREALEAMIRLKLLAHLAREAGYHQDPSVTLAEERALAEQLGLSAQALAEQLSALSVRRSPPSSPPSSPPARSPSPAPSEAPREDHAP